jgi:hypothetical protein
MNEDTSAFTRMRAAAKYRPSRARVLFIAEAPPNEESRYFYYEDVFNEDWLWIGIMKGLYRLTFGVSNQERPRKKYWLEQFRDSGYQLIDALKGPIRGSHPQRVCAIRASQGNLLSEIREICPEQIVLIKASVYEALLRPLREAGLNVVNEISLPFPSTGHQTEFQNELRRMIDSGRLFL